MTDYDPDFYAEADALADALLDDGRVGKADLASRVAVINAGIRDRILDLIATGMPEEVGRALSGKAAPIPAAPIPEPAPAPVTNVTVNVPPIVFPDFPAFPDFPTFPEQVAPVVNVEAPVVNVPAPVVHVAAPDVSVNVAAPEVTVEAPNVNVEAGKADLALQPVFVTNWPERPAYDVKRDRQGNMTGVVPK